nr:hypothetical protein [uncultured Nocardioides sp.]
MSVTPTTLTRTTGVAAAAAGLVFIGVQVGHPHLDVDSITTTEVLVRNVAKLVMVVLALVGFAGMYLSQVRRNGVLGLVGYAVISLGYLSILFTTAVSAFVLPSIAGSDPAYVGDVLAVATGGTAEGDIGTLGTVFQLQGAAYLLGGLVFGIALFRARVLTRWATLLLAVGGLVSAALSMMPDAFYRLLAFPNGIAMVALGISLFRVAGFSERPSTEPAPAPAVAR